MTLDIKLPPSHPGGYVLHWIIPDGMTITVAAKKLGVSRQSLDAVVNERRSVTPEMALKLETVFGGTADVLLRMQTAFDIYNMRKRSSQITKGLSRHLDAAPA